MQVVQLKVLEEKLYMGLDLRPESGSFQFNPHPSLFLLCYSPPSPSPTSSACSLSQLQ